MLGCYLGVCYDVVHRKIKSIRMADLRDIIHFVLL